MSDVSLAWLLARPGVVSVLAGMRNEQQVAENVRAAAVKLPADVVTELATATDELNRRFGDNPDMWEGRENTRYR